MGKEKERGDPEDPQNPPLGTLEKYLLEPLNFCRSIGLDGIIDIETATTFCPTGFKPGCEAMSPAPDSGQPAMAVPMQAHILVLTVRVLEIVLRFSRGFAV